MLRIFWPNAVSTASPVRVAGAVRGLGAASAAGLRAGRSGGGLMSAALLACVLSLPALPAAAAPDTRPQRPPVAKAEPEKSSAAPAKAEDKPANGPVLQLGIYSRDGDAWWSWKSLQQRQPELAAGLTATVTLLDGKSEAGGVALYAQVANGTDPKVLCRRIVGAGFGCLIVDRPPASATPAQATPVPAATAKAASASATSDAKAPAAAMVTAPAPAATEAPKPPAVTVAVAPPAPAPAEAKPQPSAKPEAPSGTTTSVLAPIGSAAAAPLAPPPPAVAAATPPAEGLIIYNEEDARTMADIEQHSRRKGRLRSVMPDSRYDVMPATLKKENWNLCALTFDDGPHRTVTRQVLDILNREGVRATYFPVGRIAERQGELIQDFVAGGHEIGNHSLTHSDLRKMDAVAARYEIAETNRILREFGANPVLFRPPYGRYSEELLTVVREERMGSVLWSVDTRDWQVRNADKIVSQIKLGGMPGNVFLMHSTYPSTAQALPRVIAELRAKGCEFVTLSEWLDRARNLALPKIINAGMPAPAGGTPADRQ
ncbi:polysaccharide deacetylase family protein [Azospirillum sp. BE72]|uniref:polysaccharide deacetylase family protein n=1 Tax=Azospirillum sp. BE72 TaxID=2817776 RepID=UPI00285AE350|nr:polysaccharide deacetylase family protein [Azospirillum sp. BE72]MDR6771110.1 peptidoglycan/xylan/chitin deacetylase (PgdA/CDA1 family) [Azospirillum sp. BE72]